MTLRTTRPPAPTQPNTYHGGTPRQVVFLRRLLLFWDCQCIFGPTSTISVPAISATAWTSATTTRTEEVPATACRNLLRLEPKDEQFYRETWASPTLLT